MTNKPKSKTAETFEGSPPYRKAIHVDGSGVSRAVLVPPGETDLKKGIPVSLNLDELFGHMPDSFRRDFYAALHAQGLIEPADYFKPGAAERYQRALRTVLKHDFLSIQALADKELKHHA